MISLNGGHTNGNVETLIFNAKFLELDLTYYSRKRETKHNLPSYYLDTDTKQGLHTRKKMGREERLTSLKT